MKTVDFLVIGGGIAGSSAAARLAPHGKVVLLEAEDAFGYHSSGRSATYYHFGIGKTVVRALTASSRQHFEGETLNGTPRSHQSPALFIATPDMLTQMGALERDMSPFTTGLEILDEKSVSGMVPALKMGGDGITGGLLDRTARRLDSDALLQDYRAMISREGGECIANARVEKIERSGRQWDVTTGKGERFSSPVVVNAAGAWADHIAGLAGVAPLGLRPLRRTMISIDAPAQYNVRGWPFTKTVVDDFYMLPESGKLLACPVDEVPSEPTDAQPEEYDIALAAAKVEHYTTIPVRRIAHKWAGLRTFTSDRVPVAGFAPDAEGFFWLAGQGGYGLQTAPAMSEIVEAMVAGVAWPERLLEMGVNAAEIGPGRLSLHGKQLASAYSDVRTEY